MSQLSCDDFASIYCRDFHYIAQRVLTTITNISLISYWYPIIYCYPLNIPQISHEHPTNIIYIYIHPVFMYLFEIYLWDKPRLTHIRVKLLPYHPIVSHKYSIHSPYNYICNRYIYTYPTDMKKYYQCYIPPNVSQQNSVIYSIHIPFIPPWPS